MHTNKSARCEKVSAEIKKLLCGYMFNNSIVDTIDSRMIAISAVVVSPCLQNAKVYIVSLSQSILSNENALEYLEKHVSKIRYYVGSNIRLKFTPNFKFFIDDSFEYGKKIDLLLTKITLDDNQ